MREKKKEFCAGLIGQTIPECDETEPRLITGNDLAVVMRAIRPLDSGALHCRYCPAGSNNQWQHTEHCIYEQSVKDAAAARKIVSALRVQLVGSGNQAATVVSDAPHRSAAPK